MISQLSRLSGRLIWGRVVYQLLNLRRNISLEIVRPTQRCHAQIIGFESLIFEYSGDLEPEGDRLLISFCRAIDDNLRRKIGCICQILKQRISFVIQKNMDIFACSGLGTTTRARLKSMIVLFNSCKYILREDND